MNDAQTVSGAPKTLAVGGEAVALHPLTPADLGKLQDWVDRQFPDPFDVVNAQVATGRYTVAQQQHLYRLALEQATRGRRLIGTPEADALLESYEGTIELLFLSIAKGDPAFTRGRAEVLREKMTWVDVARALSATQLDLVTSDPKGETGAAATTPPGGTASP